MVKMTAASKTPMISTAKGDRLEIICVVLLAIWFEKSFGSCGISVFHPKVHPVSEPGVFTLSA